MRDLQELLDAVDFVVGAAEGVVAAESVEGAAGAVRHLRGRRGYLGTTLVVALGGGTGSGKSSLLNAIVGEPIAPVGRLRPTTDRPLAWVPAAAEGALDRLLTDLDIHDRHLHDRDPGVALIDLPDMDSVAVSHRRLVERMTAEVDALLWVLDPEKYGDRTLHDGFLGPLAAHADQTVFVLNKVDRVPAEARGALLADVEEALVADGYSSPGVFPVAAAPADGGPQGVEALAQFLETELDHKQAVHAKLVADLAAVVKGLALEAGVWRGAAVGLDRWPAARHAAVSALDPGAGLPDDDAVCRLEDMVAVFAVTEPRLGPSLRQLLGHEAVEQAVASARDAFGAAGPEAAAAVLDARIAAPVIELAEPRARFGAIAAHAHIGARQLAARDGVLTW